MSGRPKSFDIGSLMDQSVKLFWRHGYQATSVRDVAKEANITTGTLYNEFDGKDGLFAATIEHYFNKVIKPRVDDILLSTQPHFLTKNTPDTPLLRMHHFLLSSIHNLPPAVAYQSCLLLNTKSEFGDGESIIQIATKQAYDYVSKALLKTVKQAKSLGLIDEDISDKEILIMIQIFFSGLLTTAKHTQNSKQLIPAIDLFLIQLQQPAST
jgi:AcrR family transcriptional regulator